MAGGEIGRAFDVGCGAGAFLAEIRDNAPDAELIGRSEPGLSRARRLRPSRRGHRLVEGNAEAIPLPDGSVDVVTSVYLFHELLRWSAPVMADGAAASPGGLLVLVDSLQLGDTPALDPALRGFPQSLPSPTTWTGLQTPLMTEAVSRCGGRIRLVLEGAVATLGLGRLRIRRRPEPICRCP